MKTHRILIALLCGLLMNGVASAQPNTGSSTQESKRDSNDVLFLLQESAKTEGERATQFATEAVVLSRRIHFDRGTDMGYGRLIDEFQRQNEVGQVLRTRLEYGNYLREKNRYGDMLENVMQLGNLYIQNKIYSKATTTFLEADTLSEQHRLGKRYEIDKHLAFAAQNHGLDELAWKHYESAAIQARQKGKWTDLLWILQQEAEMAHGTHKYERAYALHSAMYCLADSLNYDSHRLVAMNNMGHSAKFAGKQQVALSAFSKALVAAQKSKNLRLQGQLLQNTGVLKQVMRDNEGAIEALQKSADKYHQSGSYRDEARVKDYLAMIYHQGQQSYEALMTSNQSIEIARRGHYPDVLESSYLTRSAIYESVHEYELALADYKQHLRLQDSIQEMERKSRDHILQQQFILEQLEKERKLSFEFEKIERAEDARKDAEHQATEEKNKALQKDAENQQLIASKAKTELELLKRQRRLEQQRTEIDVLNQERERQQLLLTFEKLRADSVRQANIQLETEQTKKQLELDNEKLKSSESALKLSQEEARNRNLFLFLGGLGVVLLIIVAILFQLRSKNKRIAKQNLVILEDQKVIQAEKEKSDKLLLNILPGALAQELKEKGHATPRHYESVTVLFTDFVGFTQISEQLTPTELISTLDKVFLEFDLICERNGLSRIKTIGDSYMCVSGLPDPDKDHAFNAVKTALEMSTFIDQFNKPITDPAMRWNVRIGLHTGSVVAGVVGIKKFAFDIWGDAVNTASRMESSGEAGKVNISGATFSFVKEHFHCEHRGKISAKNKGEVDMYFVSNR
jgi:adenylate cyclase